MKTTFRMKQATDIKEAKVSILDVLEENPLWLNKVTDTLSILLRNVDHDSREWLLNTAPDEAIRDLYIKIKTEYYNFKDNTRWN